VGISETRAEIAEALAGLSNVFDGFEIEMKADGLILLFK
jgi:hypothetical protein